MPSRRILLWGFVSAFAVTAIVGSKWLIKKRAAQTAQKAATTQPAIPPQPQQQTPNESPAEMQQPKTAFEQEPSETWTVPSETKNVAPRKQKKSRTHFSSSKPRAQKSFNHAVKKSRPMRALPDVFRKGDPRLLALIEAVQSIESEFDLAPPVLLAELPVQITVAAARTKAIEQQEAPEGEEPKPEEEELEEDLVSQSKKLDLGEITLPPQPKYIEESLRKTSILNIQKDSGIASLRPVKQRTKITVTQPTIEEPEKTFEKPAAAEDIQNIQNENKKDTVVIPPLKSTQNDEPEEIDIFTAKRLIAQVHANAQDKNIQMNIQNNPDVYAGVSTHLNIQTRDIEKVDFEEAAAAIESAANSVGRSTAETEQSQGDVAIVKDAVATKQDAVGPSKQVVITPVKEKIEPTPTPVQKPKKEEELLKKVEAPTSTPAETTASLKKVDSQTKEIESDDEADESVAIVDEPPKLFEVISELSEKVEANEPPKEVTTVGNSGSFVAPPPETPLRFVPKKKPEAAPAPTPLPRKLVDHDSTPQPPPDDGHSIVEDTPKDPNPVGLVGIKPPNRDQKMLESLKGDLQTTPFVHRVSPRVLVTETTLFNEQLKPIDGAEVRLLGHSYKLATDIEGQARFENIAAQGEWTFHVEAPGFWPIFYSFDPKRHVHEKLSPWLPLYSEKIIRDLAKAVNVDLDASLGVIIGDVRESTSGTGVPEVSVEINGAVQADGPYYILPVGIPTRQAIKTTPLGMYVYFNVDPALVVVRPTDATLTSAEAEIIGGHVHLLQHRRNVETAAVLSVGAPEKMIIKNAIRSDAPTSVEATIIGKARRWRSAMSAPLSIQLDGKEQQTVRLTADKHIPLWLQVRDPNSAAALPVVPLVRLDVWNQWLEDLDLQHLQGHGHAVITLSTEWAREDVRTVQLERTVPRSTDHVRTFYFDRTGEPSTKLESMQSESAAAMILNIPQGECVLSLVNSRNETVYSQRLRVGRGWVTWSHIR